MKNLTKTNTGIIFGNDQRLKASYTGERMGSVVQKDGKRVLITMKNVRYVAELYYNMFSISALLKEECYCWKYIINILLYYDYISKFF